MVIIPRLYNSQLQPGSALLLRRGLSHALRNTGLTRLDRLTTMVPDEGLARLITSGVQDALDAEERAILAWNFFFSVLKLQPRMFSVTLCGGLPA